MPTRRWKNVCAACALVLVGTAISDDSSSEQLVGRTGSVHVYHASAQGKQPSSGKTENTRLTLVGQYAFATIAEIVALLEADPATDWRKVDLESLRQHLIDMDRVTVRSSVESSPIDGGMQFSVTGVDTSTIASIQRMTLAHAAAQGDAYTSDSNRNTTPLPWRYSVQVTDTGVDMAVSADDEHNIQRIRGLGFIGIMVSGMHHQAHHWAMATGTDPHQH